MIMAEKPAGKARIIFIKLITLMEEILPKGGKTKSSRYIPRIS